MNRYKALAGIASVMLLLVATGCKPSQANIMLRKDNERLRQKVSELELQSKADRARFESFQGPATRAALPQAALDRLYTARGLSFGKLTGGYKDDPTAAEDTGVAVHVIPTDQDGQSLKAAGSFDVQLFDLADEGAPLLASRHFSLEQARQRWYGHAMLFNYVLKVPFEKRPTHREITVRVEYLDELSGRKLTAERKATVEIGQVSQ